MTDPDRTVVLLVDDEPDVLETYRRWLDGDCDVRTASDGRDALDRLDDDVDVVILDRMMPELSGDEVLTEIREGGVDCRVAMATAVDPDIDVIEMGFDEYLAKPVTREALVGTIDRLVERAGLDAELQEYYSLMARRGALQAELSAEELAASKEYEALEERIETKRQVVGDDLGDLASDTEFVGAVREIMEGVDTEAAMAGVEDGGDTR